MPCMKVLQNADAVKGLTSPSDRDYSLRKGGYH